MKFKKSDIALGCVSFVVEQRTFDALSKKQGNKEFLSENERLLYRSIKNQLKDYLNPQTAKMLVAEAIVPQFFLKKIDEYSPSLPYAKNARSDYSANQINELSEPKNIVSLGAGFDMKWAKEFTYDKATNTLIHNKTSSSEFTVNLLDVSSDQNAILEKAFKKVFGNMPENLNIIKADISKQGWSNSLNFNNDNGVIFQANGLLAYYKEEQVDKILSECLSYKNCEQLTASVVVEPPEIKTALEQKSSARKDQKKGSDTEVEIQAFSSSSEAFTSISHITKNIEEQFGIKINTNLAMSVAGMIERGVGITPEYKQSKLAKEISKIGLEPSGEIMVSLKVSGANNKRIESGVS